MIRYLLFIFLFPFLIACQTNQIKEKQNASVNDTCIILKDTFNIISVFKNANDILAKNKFDDAVKFIESKGNLRILKRKNRHSDFESWKDIKLQHHIDTCNDKIITQNFTLKNVAAKSCYFKAITPLKGSHNYFAGFYFQQWSFADNVERDSAFKILNWVYSNNEYEKKYNQTIFDDKRIYLIESNAKIFEETAIQYAKYLKNKFVKIPYN